MIELKASVSTNTFKNGNQMKDTIKTGLTPAISVAEVRESPYVTQAHSIPNARQHKI